MIPVWRLLITGARDAAWNMACDEALSESVHDGISAPVVRFFQWEPPALSFGYSQKVDREVNLARVHADGIGIVRRVSGGRAVFHADEVTYSVICRQDDPVASGGITATYFRISEGLADGVRRCGLNATLAHQADPGVSPRSTAATLPCFGSTARAEIVIGGRKLVGSAQHRTRDLMLQHGSILTGPRHKDIVNWLHAEEAVRDRFRRVLDSSTTSMSEAGWRGNDAAAIEYMAEGMRATLNLEWDREPLSPTEQQRIDELVETKYATDGWTFSPRGHASREQ